jgi:hypothetical protein
MLSLVSSGLSRIPFKDQRHINLRLLRFHLKELRHIAEFLIASFEQFRNRQSPYRR